MNTAVERAAAYWNNVGTVPRKPRTRWWESKTIIRHINNRVCGEPVDGLHAGFHRLLSKEIGAKPAAKAVSVGAGTGFKERALLACGAVQEFHLYEISSERIRTGIEQAQKANVAHRMHFYQADAFEACAETNFDLVYWNNALHHMMDTTRAVRWSRDRLKDGGIFAMDDFIGPSRFQWTDTALGFARQYRASLPASMLSDPRDPSKPAKPIERPTVEYMLRMDPSEAADSSSILPALHSTFSAPMVVMTGGAIYHAALNDILVNFDDDGTELQAALALDHALSMMGENHYAVAIARKTRG